MRLCEVADVLNCSSRTVYRLVAEGQIQAVQIRGGWRVDPDDLAAFITRRKQEFAESFGFCDKS